MELFQQFESRPLLEMELLKTFLAVVHCGGLKPAAKRVFRSQGAVSMQLKKLESQVGGRLMTRSNQGIQLTQAGQTLKEYAERLMALNLAALSATGQPPLTGRLRIGVPSDYLPALIQRVMGTLASNFPMLEANIVCRRSRELQTMMTLGELDMAIIADQPPGEGVRKLWQDELVWAGVAASASDAGPLPVALFCDDCVVRDWAMADLKEAAIDYRIVVSSPAMDNLVAAANQGFAAALVPSSQLSTPPPPSLRTLFPKPRVLTISLVSQPGLEEQLVKRVTESMVGVPGASQ